MKYTILDAKIIKLNNTHVAIFHKIGKNNYVKLGHEIVVTNEEYHKLVRQQKQINEEFEKMKIDILKMLLNEE